MTEYVQNAELPVELQQPDEALDYYLKGRSDDPKWCEEPSAVDAKDMGTPDEWVKRHPDLIRLTGRHPFNCEPPLRPLFNKGFITPVSLHYVRNHGAAPNINWHEHKVYVGGLSPQKLELSMADIVKLPRKTLPATLVCCGNRRKEQNMIKQSKGFNWGAAGLATSVWSGVSLVDFLKVAGITSVSAFPPGMHIRFASCPENGGDTLPGGIYGTSITLEKALDPSQDVLIAYMCNGRLLSTDHGFPIRIIIPGYIGGRMIKWLTHIDLLATESQDFYHFYDNRVFPPHVDAEKANAEDWWHRPEYICNDLSVNSAISSPDHDEVLEVPSDDEEKYVCKGYAYCGGGRNITRVELSLDGGHTWTLADIDRPERPNAWGKRWCWCFWTASVSIKEMGSAAELCLRAFDEGFNGQPCKPTWNLMGMLNNPWYRLKIHKLNGGKQITFEAPTQAGQLPGGWMARMKGHPALTAPGTYNPHDDVSSTASGASTARVDTPIDEEEAVDTWYDATKPKYTLEEVAQHDTVEKGMWIVVRDMVYDTTPFLEEHPGGASSIVINAGIDCTEDFEAVHSTKAWKQLESYYIGNLDKNSKAVADKPDLGSGIEENVALNPKKHIAFPLKEKIALSHDTVLLRFALQSENHRLGLPVGQHMFFFAKIDGKPVMRQYTPTSSDHDLGHFDLVVKVYTPTERFPKGGVMSQHLGALNVGDTIKVQGPVGDVTYEGRGALNHNGKPYQVRSFAMMCGGTGITPMYQLIKAILRDEDDTTKMFLLYANKSEDDILLRPELEELRAKYPDRFQVTFTVDKHDNPDAWVAGGGFVGFMNHDLIEKSIPAGGEGNCGLFCGPPGLKNFVVMPALKKLNYSEEMRICF